MGLKIKRFATLLRTVLDTSTNNFYNFLDIYIYIGANIYIYNKIRNENTILLYPLMEEREDSRGIVVGNVLLGQS